MIDLKEFEPKPTCYKAIFRNHGISNGTIANYLGRSYQYVCSILNGQFRMTPEIEKELKKLVSQLLEEEQDGKN
jgi:hypothetical protein